MSNSPVFVIATVLLLTSLGGALGAVQPAATTNHQITSIVTDGNGNPLAGVRIQMSYTSGGMTTTYTNYTNSAGKCTSEPLPPQNYTVTAFDAGYAPNTSYLVNLSNSNVTLYFTLSLLMGNLTGFVTTSNIPVANASVMLSNTNITFVTRSTSPLGLYRFAGIPSGKYNISATEPGYVGYNGTVTVTPGNTTLLDITMKPTLAILTGTVNTAQQGGKIEPLAGVNVTVQSSNGIVYHTTTNAQGLYYFTNLSAGVYTVSVQASGYTPGQGSIAVALAKTSYLNFTLPQLTRSTPFNIPGFIGNLDLDHSLVLVALLIVLVVVSGTMVLLNKTYNWKEPREPNNVEKEEKEEES